MTQILLSAVSARRGGGRTYLRHIVAEFPADDRHCLTILSASRIEGVTELANVRWLAAPGWTENPVLRFLLGSFYFRWLWKSRNDFDVVYYPGGSFDIPLPRKVKRAVAFRNMLPFDEASARLYPLGWMRLRHWMLKYLQAHAFRSADLVIFISRYARSVIDGIVDRRGTAVVIPHGVTATTGTLSTALQERLPEKFVLYLSILDYYKAQVELVDAWARLRAIKTVEEKLVLAGPTGSRYTERVRAAIAHHGLEDHVILLGEVSYDQVFDLARRARLNVFMSLCENCPNIMLELMRVGCPLLVSNRQPMPELGGEYLEYVDPTNVEAVAHALARLIDDDQRLNEIGQAALVGSLKYDWPRAGRETWASILALG